MDKLKLGDIVKVTDSMFKNRWYKLVGYTKDKKYLRLRDHPNIFKAPLKNILSERVEKISKAELAIYS